jgi:lipid II:glycine glycyltransferase (peptidoglycan interpeptide bridge formation enzyme)
MISASQNAPGLDSRVGPLAGEIGQLRDLTAGSWDRLLGQFEDASIYQTTSYGACHWSRDQLRWHALEIGGRAVAIAQLRVVRIPLLKQGIAYLRWGPLCRLKGEPFDAEALKQLAGALKREYVERRGLMLRVLPAVFQDDPHAAAFQSSLTALGIKRDSHARPFRTIRLDLSGSLESLRKGLDGKWRNMLNSAERNGLTVEEGADLACYDRFLAAYREMMERKRFETTVNVEEFRAMQSELPPPFKMQTFLCLKEGKVLNALVLSPLGDTAIYLLGATSDVGLKLKGAYLLQWRAIQWLKERGCRWYDLGGFDPVRNPGVYHFKSGFGGQETEQLGTFELSGSRTSEFCVRAGERLQGLVRRWRAGSNPKKPAGTNNGNGSPAALQKAE